jgi:hypothetical protein
MTTFNGTLDVTIADAQLNSPQHLSKQDPYCVVTLGSSGAKRLVEGESWGKDRFQTKVQSGGGQHPAWNESHTFSLKNMKLDSHLKVKLYDKDTIKDDYIGVCSINLSELLPYDKKGVQYFPMCKKGWLGKDKTDQIIGKIGVGVTFNCTEMPQGHADIKSQARDVLTRKGQQMGGVSDLHQQATPAHIQGQGQMQQGLMQGTQQGTYQGTVPQTEQNIQQGNLQQDNFQHQGKVPLKQQQCCDRGNCPQGQCLSSKVPQQQGVHQGQGVIPQKGFQTQGTQSSYPQQQ